MSRNFTNFIRFLLDGFLPPILRSNKYFMYPLFYLWYKGKNVSKYMEFKTNILSLTNEEYVNFYKNYNSLANRSSDLNYQSIDFILKQLGDNKNSKIIDIGCGNGYLLQVLKSKGFNNLYGSDIINKIEDNEITFFQATIESLPFNDGDFDIVICNHTIEHVIKLNDAINELKRVSKNKLIITTPCQSYNKYTFDLHINFFPQEFDLIRLINLEKYSCELSGGDWSYVGYIK